MKTTGQCDFPVETAAPEGNAYVRDVTVHGVPTFRHVATGEVLHGQVGPWKEAWQLYLEPSDLLHRKGEATVYDLGLGCGAQLLACLDAFKRNPDLSNCEVVSFDLEKAGLVALLADATSHPHALAHKDDLERFVQADDASVVEVHKGARVFRWRFLRGDFRETMLRDDLPLADFFFFDFFSPSSHPWLWRPSVFRRLRELSTPQARLITYASATCARTAIVSGGFYIGYGIPSGRKVKSTVGACRLEDLDEPFPPKWRDTFLASHKPFLPDASDEEKAEVTESLLSHPQFSLSAK
ncbi:MAG: hypothetical protein IOD12_05750 [Silvanigrellales bacterium]|nr:hypothetical protein [Silvanigrellales bacterium]